MVEINNTNYSTTDAYEEALRPACSPYEFLKDVFEEAGIDAQIEFESLVEANGLERDYEEFKNGVGADPMLLKIIGIQFGNYDFWLNASMNYLSYIARIHFPKRVVKK